MKPDPAMLLARIIVAALAATALPARADERSLLDACQPQVDRAGPSGLHTAAAGSPGEEELERCRQIIREWTLRDSRMTVDEHGRPLR
ncbi:MAG: hypothetical protein QOF07_886 [Bradyrhizobium sp.]|nr:hypothetical protein [Bradyrhizobium sp.]